ncbi:MAG: hypothetical protein BMS9Abin02_1123 [Anaerolineae bacterium]|nr:MAG: hypothetical protein BMS9Abin02_1123 [Anaerolineae bacterium]
MSWLLPVFIASNQSPSSTGEVLRLAASTERGSEHSLGEADARQAEEEQLSLSVPAAFAAITDVGIALGAVTDVAMETADVTLINDDLHGVLKAIRLSSATMGSIKQNLSWVFGYNIVLIHITSGILAPLEWAPDFLRQLHHILAAAAMTFSGISIVSNALRLKRVQL